MNQYWWIETSEEQASGCVRYAVSQYSYARIKKGVWQLYRTRTDREDLSCYDKMLLWAISERYRKHSMSTSDSINYLAKMIGVNRKTAGKSFQRLLDKDIIWVAQEGSVRKAYRKLEARTYFHKHILLVGLSYMLAEGGS